MAPAASGWRCWHSLHCSEFWVGFFSAAGRAALQQVMQLYAAGYTIADICHLKCYFSRGTEMALKKAVALLDTGKLLSVSKRQAQYLALQNQINPHFPL